MKFRYTDNYVKNKNYIKNALKTTKKRPMYTKHHLLPLQFIDESPTINLPYDIHISLHKNFTNHQLMIDPISPIIKCLEQRQPIERIPITLECFIKKQPLIKYKKLDRMIKNGFASNMEVRNYG